MTATAVVIAMALIIAATAGVAPVTTMPTERGDSASMADHVPTHHDGFVRFMTYNIHWGLGADGVRDLERIAAVLRDTDADVVLLTEVDVNWRRSGNVDQPAYLARAAGYPHWYFGRALTTWASGNRRLSYYGNLLLSRFPIVDAETVALPRPPGREPRAVVAADILIDGKTVTVLGTHLGLSRTERMQQVARIRELVGADPETTVLLGDFNARPASPEIDALTRHAGLLDTQALLGVEEYTFPAPAPYARIDYIFVSPDLADAVIHSGTLSVAGSDHLPVVVDIARPERARPPLASAPGSR